MPTDETPIVGLPKFLGWDCACGMRVGEQMLFCSSCWADRATGDRLWAKLPFMDLRPGGEVLNGQHDRPGGAIKQ
jgi:hypothetical protein